MEPSASPEEFDLAIRGRGLGVEGADGANYPFCYLR
jgi:hypothetical protein